LQQRAWRRSNFERAAGCALDTKSECSRLPRHPALPKARCDRAARTPALRSAARPPIQMSTGPDPDSDAPSLSHNIHFREPHSRRFSCFYVQNDFSVEPANDATAERNLARSSTKSNLTHDHNATSHQNLVNPNLNKKSSKAGEQVSASQRHSLCTRRFAVAQSPARSHPSRDTLTSRKHSLGAGATPTPPAASRTHGVAPRARRATSVTACIQCSLSAVASPRCHSPELRWRSLHPRGFASRRRPKRDAKLGTRVVTNHRSRHRARQVSAHPSSPWRSWRLGGWSLSQAQRDAEGL
jgi:hypothetical protein